MQSQYDYTKSFAEMSDKNQKYQMDLSSLGKKILNMVNYYIKLEIRKKI